VSGRGYAKSTHEELALIQQVCSFPALFAAGSAKLRVEQ
jgi:hypothetical protein